MFQSAEEESSLDFLDLDEVRQGWAQAQTTPQANIPVVVVPKQSVIAWEDEVRQRFAKVRAGLVEYFPDYVETFDVLFQSLDADLKAWLGIPNAPSEMTPEATERPAMDDGLEAWELENESEQALLEVDPDEAGKAFEKGLMELENFLEAIFVDGDFWRLMR